MKDGPIIFTGANVLNILNGLKTQTRRVVSPATCKSLLPNSQRQIWSLIEELNLLASAEANGDALNLIVPEHLKYNLRGFFIESRHKVGQRLWVKENILIDGVLDPWYAANGPGGVYVDARNENDLVYRDPEYTGTVPSIYMPRWASRLTLNVTDVKIERLQDISEADAKAEGIATATIRGGGNNRTVWHLPEVPGHINISSGLFGETPRLAYQRLWESINAKRKDGAFAWDKNPWVVATTFTAHPINIDALDRGDTP